MTRNPEQIAALARELVSALTALMRTNLDAKPELDWEDKMAVTYTACASGAHIAREALRQRNITITWDPETDTITK